MASNKEIQDRINSIKDTRKITNAMYLIASSKLRTARKNYDNVEKYFHMIRMTMHDILEHAPEMKHEFLDDDPGGVTRHRRRVYIVVTADKGLAGAYNQNVIRLMEEKLAAHPDAILCVIGQIGRHYFKNKHLKSMNEDFLYSAQNPSLERARSITAEILDMYWSHEISEVHIVYTEMKNALQSVALERQLLPLCIDDYCDVEEVVKSTNKVSFFPNANAVFEEIAPICMQGIIFSALTESYCAELNDRMAAMDGASKSADEMIAELQLEYNRSRQGSITQEITEVISGSKAPKKKKKL